MPLQEDPSQQGSPGAPQTLHTEPWQTVPDSQLGVVLQQGSPGPPQVMQVPPVDAVVEHLVPCSAHTAPQQVWPAAPQPLQRPAWQLPDVVPQAEPAARQVPA